MRDAGHRTPDAGHRTAKKAKIIYPPPRGVDIIMQVTQATQWPLHETCKRKETTTHRLAQCTHSKIGVIHSLHQKTAPCNQQGARS